MLGEVEVHLRRRLGAGSHLEDHADAVDGLLLAGRGDVEVGRDQGDRAQRGRLAEAGADLAVWSAAQLRPVHVGGAPPHRGAGEDVLGDRVVGEAGRRQHRDPALGHLLGGDDALGAAEVVDVAVAVDEPGDRALAPVLAVEGQRRRRGLGRDQRVDDDDPLLALDDVHVGEVEAAQLVEAGRDLEQAGDAVEQALAPEAGVDGVGRLALEEVVGLEVPDRVAALAGHGRRLEAGDQPPSRLGEVLVVGERQRGRRLAVAASGVLAGRPALVHRFPARAAATSPGAGA